MKPIKALGDPKRMLPAHQPFARLRGSTEAWPAKFGVYAGYAFKGYRLAADGTPTFRYAIAGLEVEDTLRPAADGRSLRRTVLVRRGRDAAGADQSEWYFRGLSAGVTPQPIEWQGDTATIEEKMSL